MGLGRRGHEGNGPVLETRKLPQPPPCMWSLTLNTNQLASLLSTPAPFPYLLAVSYVFEKTEAIRKGLFLPHHQSH